MNPPYTHTNLSTRTTHPSTNRVAPGFQPGIFDVVHATIVRASRHATPTKTKSPETSPGLFAFALAVS